MASAALAIPGVVLGIGYLRTFHGIELPFTDEPFTAFWLIIVIAYAVRRLPYALRSCMAALQQLHVSLEEAAENLGATKQRTIYAHRGTAHGGRHPRRLRHELHDRGGRALGHHHADRRRKATRRCPTASISTCSASPAAVPAPRSE